MLGISNECLKVFNYHRDIFSPFRLHFISFFWSFFSSLSVIHSWASYFQQLHRPDNSQHETEAVDA